MTHDIPLHIRAKFELMWRALESIDITELIVHFDGSGDTGDIEDIDANPMADDQTRLELQRRYDEADVMLDDTSMKLSDLVLENAWHLLDLPEAPDWVNNEGGFGEIHFVAATEEGEPSITIEYNIRIVQTEFYQHDYDRHGVAYLATTLRTSEVREGDPA